MRLFRKILAFFILGFALLLPWKLRCLYMELIGWAVQFLYKIYLSVLKIVIGELVRSGEDGAHD